MSEYDDYRPPEPAADAIDRIMAAIDRGAAADAGGATRAGRWRWPLAVVCTAAAAFAVAWFARGGASAGGTRVQQDSGIAVYEVVPGTRLDVVTPAGTVRALGTRFRVEVRSMKRSTKHGMVAAAAAALVVVAVYQGTVWLGNDRGETVVHAGEVGHAASDGVPQLGASSTAAAPPVADTTPRPGPRRFANPEERAALTRAIAAARARRDAALPAPVPEAAESGPKPVARPLGDLDKDYIRGRIQEVIPLIQECYELALVDSPTLGGKVITEFVISGEPEIGGLVEEARFVGDESTLNHPGLNECMSATLESIEFEPPPDGGKVVVRYPFLFSTDGPPDE